MKKRKINDMMSKDIMAVCDDCNGEREYSIRFDAYYCKLCDKWLEIMCGDPNCAFCTERPLFPSMVSDHNKEFNKI